MVEVLNYLKEGQNAGMINNKMCLISIFRTLKFSLLTDPYMEFEIFPCD